MMKRKNRMLVAVIIVVLLISAGVIYANLANSKERAKIRLGVLPVIDTLPLYVAQEEKIFEKQGVTVELVEFGSAMERDTAFAAGNIDGYFGDMVNTLMLRNSGQDVKVITVDYHSVSNATMFALLASPGSKITDLSQVEGHSVATSRASISEYFLDKMLADKTSSVSKTEVRSISIRYQMLMNNQTDLALLPEPFASEAISGGAKLIADDRGLNETATVIALRSSFISANQELIKGFLSAYNESVNMVNKDPLQYSSILENQLNFPRELEQGYVFPPLSNIMLPTEKEVRDVEAWMTGYGILSADIPYDSVVCSELYE